MTLWDRRTLATRYEAVLPDSIEVVKQNLKCIEQLQLTRLKPDDNPTAEYRCEFQSYTFKDREEFTITQIEGIGKGRRKERVAQVRGDLSQGDTGQTTHIGFRAYPQRTMIVLATLAALVLVCLEIRDFSHQHWLILFLGAILILGFLIYGISLLKTRDDLYHRVVKVLTDPTMV